MKCLVLLLVMAKLATGAKILAHFITPSVSHQAVYRNIWKELSSRGHQVVVITPNPFNDPRLVNLTEVDVSFSYKFVERLSAAESAEKMNEDVKLDKVFLYFLPYILDVQMQNQQVRDIYGNVNNENYDLVLVEMFYPVVYALSHKYGCPYVGISSFSGIKPIERSVGNPSHSAAYPDAMLDYDDAKTLWTRLHSVYNDISTYLR
ncbi:uncharacterized protein LOC112905628 [Agrilus planipennis]|uniref:Uncharacterized protein LOC112905628 n=1 Tax=Agrilus planipennis TaxID=224129 RepID=A0A7F5RE06_AGRPL|nr:uncharacterized protein LOC112905628 [Agrilus planipennis]